MREYFTAIIPDTIDENLAVLHQFRSNHKGDLQQKLKDLNAITAAFSVQKKPGFWNKFRIVHAAIQTENLERKNFSNFNFLPKGLRNISLSESKLLSFERYIGVSIPELCFGVRFRLHAIF